VDLSLEPRWKTFVETAVKEGRFASASDVVSEGLRLVAEQEAKLHALREALDAAIARGGRNTATDLSRLFDQKEAELSKSGF
jgi:antitoxin ParD1/3/4